jgi:uncharacterized alkaline shock family protein YloU
VSTAAPAAPGTELEPVPAGEPLPPLPDAAERGRVTVADRVVERVAGFAVTRVDGAVAAPRRLLGMNFGEARPEAGAAVSARVQGHTATIQVTIAVTWPQPIRAVADRVRQAIREDVARITDVQVAQVDLDVVSLPTATAPRRRVQ